MRPSAFLGHFSGELDSGFPWADADLTSCF